MVTKMDVLDVYALGLAFLEEGQTFVTWARTRQGDSTYITNHAAVQFCLVGALSRAAYELRGEEFNRWEPQPLLDAVLDGLAAQLGDSVDLRRGRGDDTTGLLSDWYEMQEPALPEIQALFSQAAHALSAK